jgi:16S rRNA processing protein RimM
VSEAGNTDEPLVAVALIGKPRGIRGEVTANLLTDFPERFDQRTRFLGLHPDGRRETLELEKHWFQGNRVILKFAGYDTPEAAKDLSGVELAVAEGECGGLEPDEFYDWQLEGCRVETLDGETLGTVRALMRTGGVELLAVTPAEGRRREDYLIPFARAICLEVDVAQKVIRVDPPEGLLDL